MRKPGSYLVNGLLAGAVFLFAFDLARGDRGLIDFVVLGLVGAAILWNIFRLSQRLFRFGGVRDVWHVQRTVLFWIIGLFNTPLVRAADAGPWGNLFGWILLVLAAVDSVWLYRKERKGIATLTAPAAERGGDTP